MSGYEVDQWSAQRGGAGLETIPSWLNPEPSVLQEAAYRPSVPYVTPAVVVQAVAPGPFDSSPWGKDVFLRYGHNTDEMWEAPKAYARRSTYPARTPYTTGAVAFGTAPTHGIYTGQEDYL